MILEQEAKNWFWGRGVPKMCSGYLFCLAAKNTIDFNGGENNYHTSVLQFGPETD
jgi:hypothetical protein